MKKAYLLGTVASLVAVFSFAATGASAATDADAEAAPPTSTLEEIVVTARRKEEKLQEVPGTVAAVTGNDLDTTGARTSDDLTNLVPGMVLESFGGIQTDISMRGSFNRIGGTSGVGFFQNGVFLDLNELTLGMIDDARVEVAKGPQATLYGRGTQGGAVNFVTNDPTSTPEGYLEAGGGGSSVHDEGLYHVQAVISGPLVGDSLLGRLVLANQERDGYVYDPVTGYRGLGYDKKFGRATLKWIASDTFDIKLMAQYQHDDPKQGVSLYPGNSGLTSVFGQDPAPIFTGPISIGPNIWTTRFSERPTALSEDENFNLEMNWQTPIGKLTSLSGYSHTRTNALQDASATQYGFVNVLYPSVEEHYSEELRFTGGDRLKYVLGAYILKDEDTTQEYVNATPYSIFYLGGLASEQLFSTTDLLDYSVFGQLGYDITEQFNITGGVRLQRDKLSGVALLDEILFAGGSTVLGGGPTFTYPAGPYQRSAQFDGVAGNLVATYHFNPDILAYASYGRGNKPGGLNAPVPGPTGEIIADTPYGPETVDSYEIGFKGTEFDHRLRTNVALFDAEYRGLQLQRSQYVTIGSTEYLVGLTSNDATARAYGVDVDVAYLLPANFKISVNYSYLKAKILTYTSSGSALLTGNLAGLPIPRSPENSGTVSLDWSDRVGPGTLSLGANVYFSSSYINDFVAPSTPGLPIQLAPSPAYHTLNLTGSYTQGRWELSAYVRNLLNEQYIATAYDDFYNAIPTAVPGEPRTFEFTVKRKFL
jgi:iron complex outermembrane receptor protein